ncbi:hypothetical protein ROR02_08620 [Pararhodospirillum oryzae]|uniref:Uncharacterized protein n=1 Tax=Pararhodospirillum oryzae TaxID=478448 RepID=A0A512H5M6_9PROT|nr:hypothetical protein ROR02_08620 [Pararhodospirillum oryzae]
MPLGVTAWRGKLKHPDQRGSLPWGRASGRDQKTTWGGFPGEIGGLAAHGRGAVAGARGALFRGQKPGARVKPGKRTGALLKDARRELAIAMRVKMPGESA